MNMELGFRLFHNNIIIMIIKLVIIIFIYYINYINAKGYFSVKQLNNTWWLYTPNNRTFLSKAVSVVNWDTGYCPKLKYSPYHQNVLKKYNNSRAAWANATNNRLNSWGFNTMGAWTYSATEDFPNWYYVRNLDYAANLDADWFSNEFIKGADIYTALHVKPYVNDTNLIGYFTGNEINWGTFVDRSPILFRENNTKLIEYLTFNTSAAGYKRAVIFLQSKYNTLNDLSVAWNLNITSYDMIRDLLPFISYSDQRIQDYNEFLYIVATQYFKVVYESFKKYDSYHLMLGSRYSFWELPPQVVKAESPYTDIISYNGYNWYPNFDITFNIYRLHELSGGKPAFNNTSNDPNNSLNSAGWPVLTQHDRAVNYKEYIKNICELKCVVGYHWFQYVDDPPLGRFDGENSNFGVVNIYDDEYEVLTKMMTNINRDEADLWHYEANI